MVSLSIVGDSRFALSFKLFDSASLRDIIDHACAVGVSLMQTVCTTIEEFPVLLEIANGMHKYMPL
ncbi:hypothetical protein [Anaplasma phagocytophilum]|uniref:Hydrolase, TatD family domain protein n=1 Tax=Anaplasma phagocytophilum str. NCH-1 TaxID=1359161 RepID=A0A0F3MU54_ANAPH|nr:hypothetical protein [Anaplasma phagocytophilum]KJV59308.1 hydrolase, TatD family domain protein [Anaplasma phagocytophilum str. NCH-1]